MFDVGSNLILQRGDSVDSYGNYKKLCVLGRQSNWPRTNDDKDTDKERDILLVLV
jgi:hypothetical protein